MAKFQDLDGVILQDDMPHVGLHRCMIGTIIHIFAKPTLAYEVEFSGSDGKPIAQVPLTEEKLQKIVAAS